MRHLTFMIETVLVASSIGVLAQDSARTVQYHSQDIIPIRAKLKYTTLIELPTTEKIMQAVPDSRRKGMFPESHLLAEAQWRHYSCCFPLSR